MLIRYTAECVPSFKSVFLPRKMFPSVWKRSTSDIVIGTINWNYITVLHKFPFERQIAFLN